MPNLSYIYFYPYQCLCKWNWIHIYRLTHPRLWSMVNGFLTSSPTSFFIDVDMLNQKTKIKKINMSLCFSDRHNITSSRSLSIQLRWHPPIILSDFFKIIFQNYQFPIISNSIFKFIQFYFSPARSRNAKNYLSHLKLLVQSNFPTYFCNTDFDCF